MSFQLALLPLYPSQLSARLADARAGACVTFEGWVRNHHGGHAVTALEYEAYAVLAEKEGARIVAEVSARHELINAHCVHRVGRLELGELAVWIGVTAAHRGPAFAACRDLIDEIKARVPIWKKEYYADGVSLWVNCATRGPHAEGQAPV
jgi:molybdopterin synthase catalytic subunit